MARTTCSEPTPFWDFSLYDATRRLGIAPAPTKSLSAFRPLPERLNSLDRCGIVVQEPGRNEQRHQLDPSTAPSREDLAENRGRILLAVELPEGHRLPEQDLVVSGRQAG